MCGNGEVMEMGLLVDVEDLSCVCKVEEGEPEGSERGECEFHIV